MNTKQTLAAAAIAGLFAGSLATASASMSGSSTPNAGMKVGTFADKGTHSCKGQNACKGQGGCKAGDKGCKAENSCKGKGGCATDGSKK